MKLQWAIVAWLDADEASGHPTDHRCLRTSIGFLNPEDRDEDYLILWTDRDIHDDDPRKTDFSSRIRIPHGMVRRVIQGERLEPAVVRKERARRG